MFLKTAIFFVTLCVARAVSQAEQQQQQQQQQQQPAIIRVNDTKAFRQVLDTYHDVLVVYSKQETLPTELGSALDSIDTAFPDLAIVHVPCGAATKRLCKHVSADRINGTLASEFVIAHYRAGRFNRVLRHTDEQSLMAFLANPYANPCDDDAQVTGYTCVNTIRDFAAVLNNGTKLVTLFYATWNKLVESTKNSYSEVAKSHADRANFIALDVASPQTAMIAQAFEVTLLPSVVVVEAPADAQCNVYLFSGNATNATELTEWLDSPSLSPSSHCDVNSLLQKLDSASLSSTTLLADIAESITVVNESNYDVTINQTVPIMMLIHSSACRDCEKLVAEFQRAQDLLRAENSTGLLVILDADESPELTRRWKIAAYPTLEYILNGVFQFILQSEKFQTAEEIVSFFRLTEKERLLFRKLWIKPYVFSVSLKRLTPAEAVADIPNSEHSFIMELFNATTVEQEIQQRKAIKELSKAIDHIVLSNVTTPVNFILLNCTSTPEDSMCNQTATKQTMAAFRFSYYRNGTLVQQAVAEDLLEAGAVQNATVDSLLLKVKHRDILRWGANVSSIALNADEHGEHKQKEILEKKIKREKKEKTPIDEAAKKAEKKEAKLKEEKLKEEKGKKSKTEL